MAQLITPYLFTWQEVEARSDLERLRLVFDHIEDEAEAVSRREGSYLQ